jgi:cation transport regulator ChaC
MLRAGILYRMRENEVDRLLEYLQQHEAAVESISGMDDPAQYSIKLHDEFTTLSVVNPRLAEIVVQEKGQLERLMEAYLSF